MASGKKRSESRTSGENRAMAVFTVIATGSTGEVVQIDVESLFDSDEVILRIGGQILMVDGRKLGDALIVAQEWSTPNDEEA